MCDIQSLTKFHAEDMKVRNVALPATTNGFYS